MSKQLIMGFALSFMLMLGVFALPASAQVNDAVLVNSGDNFEVDLEAETEVDIDVDNTNTATVTQVINATANTGGNTANRNIGATSIDTGNAGVATNMTLDLNNNTTAVDLTGTGMGGTNIIDVVNTGDDADIEAEAETEVDIDVDNTNTATVYQSCGSTLQLDILQNGRDGCSASTGGNTANRNVGDVDVSTGNAGVSTSLDAMLNHNTTLVSLGGLGEGLLNDITVTNTGDDFELDAEAELDVDIDVDNSNSASVNQFVNARASTGHNRANRNVGDVTIDTGDAGILTTLDVEANHNITGIDWSGDSGGGENLVVVVNTGDDADIEAETEVEVDGDVDNTNSFTATQDLSVQSRTGWNISNRSVGSVSVETGNAGTAADADVMGNHNMTFFGDIMDFLLDLLDM